MATYVPNASDTAEPTVSRTVKSAAQEFRTMKEKLQRALVVPEEGPFPELPSAAERALSYLAFDAYGDPIVTNPDPDDATAVALALATYIASLANSAAAVDGFNRLAYNPANAYTTGAGQFFNYIFGRTIGEIAVGVTPTNYQFAPGNVFRYGAKGDGITDDSVPVQQAIYVAQASYDPAIYGSNSPANGTCVVFFPSGYYKITSALVVTKKVAFEGPGQSEFSSGARIVQFTPNTDLFVINPIAQGMSVSFEKLSLISNAGGNGDLVHVTRTTSYCNSQRYKDCVFGTPQRLSINIEGGDDIEIKDCLFDVSSNNAISFGTTDPVRTVSNVRVTGCAFFAIPTRCFLLYNVNGLVISNNVVYPASPATSTAYFVDGYNSIPYQIKNVVICNNVLKSVNCLSRVTNIEGITVSGNVCTDAGLAGASTLSFIQFNATCSKVTVVGNSVTGAFGTKSFYDDEGSLGSGTVSSANVTGNSFTATSGTGQAISSSSTTGTIANNTLVGFPTSCVGGKFTTTGSAFAPGTVNTAAVNTVNYTVTGALVGDRVLIRPITGTWPVANNVFPQGLVTATNTMTVRYSNPTAGNIAVAAHDWIVEVSR
jgi:hypothetical protein